MEKQNKTKLYSLVEIERSCALYGVKENRRVGNIYSGRKETREENKSKGATTASRVVSRVWLRIENQKEIAVKLPMQWLYPALLLTPNIHSSINRTSSCISICHFQFCFYLDEITLILTCQKFCLLFFFFIIHVQVILFDVKFNAYRNNKV